ncbi:hypothetical protein QUC31_000335 [Theobroma cacao]
MICYIECEIIMKFVILFSLIDASFFIEWLNDCNDSSSFIFGFGMITKPLVTCLSH